MVEKPTLPEDLLVARARLRGLAFERDRARAARPQVESLLARLARFADLLPREAMPPPLGTLDRPASPEREP